MNARTKPAIIRAEINALEGAIRYGHLTREAYATANTELTRLRALLAEIGEAATVC